MITKFIIHSFFMLCFLSAALLTSGSHVQVDNPPAGDASVNQDNTNLLQAKVKIEVAHESASSEEQIIANEKKRREMVKITKDPDLAVQLMAVEAWSGKGDNCKALMTRLDSLTAQDLTGKVGNDPLFPPNMGSIASGTGTCGDSAAGISDDCTKYNEWHKLQQYTCKDFPGAKSGKKWFDGYDSCAEYEKWSNFCADYGATDWNGEGTANNHCCACGGGDRSGPLKVIGPSGIEFSDIAQGKLGDCYFLAALASIAYSQPQVLSDLFVERELWVDNIYKTKWLVNGRESTVIVDNMIPGSSKNIFFVEPSETGEFWPVILEKAWGKIYGSFKRVEGGWWSQAVGALTRAPVVNLYHKSVPKDKVWDALITGTAKGFPMGAGTSASSNAGAYGLASGHQYSALEAFVKDGKKYIKLYNPWSSDNYKGVVKNVDNQDGVFEMTLDEYYDAFIDTEYAYLVPGYKVSSTKIPTAGRTVKSISVAATGPFYVSVTWPGKRMLEPCEAPNPDVTLAVGMKGALNTPSFGTKLNVANTAHAEIISGPGDYEIFAGATFPNNAWLEHVYLSVYAAEAVTFSTSTLTEKDAVEAMLRVTKQGCECMQSWGYAGQKVTDFCGAPDGDPNDWCFTVEGKGCANNWGYCKP